jgi:hypothetical protein
MNTTILEYFEGRPAGRIDAGKAAIFGVKILGEQSANPPPHNNFYPIQTRRASAKLFENIRVFLNHPARENAAGTRPYEDAMGLLKNVHEAGDGLRGDWLFPPKHPLAANVLWDAAHAEHGLAFSINAEADKIRFDGDRKVIENFARVNSVDLVSRGATVRGLFESRRPPVVVEPRPPVKLTGIYAARLRAVDAAIEQGRYTRTLRESICAAASEAALDGLLARAGVIVVPVYVRDGKSFATWVTS